MKGKDKDMLAHALRYAKRGWFVFPLYPIKSGTCTCGKDNCKSAGKCPIVRWGKGKESHENARSLKAYAATTDPELIKAWWQRWPNAGIGVACGPSSLVCLDVDLPHGEESLNDYTIPTTSEARTGSGGKHFIFTGDRRSRNGAREGVDIKGHGGYFVAPPSLHRSGDRYEWKNKYKPVAMPTWLKDMKAKNKKRKKVQSCTISADLDEVNRALCFIDPDDGYDTWLKVGMALHSVGDFKLWLDWSRRSVDFDEAECMEKWQSFTNTGGVTVDSVFYLARIGGYEEKAQEGVRVIAKPDTSKLLEKMKARSYEPPAGHLRTIYHHTLQTARRRQPVVALSAALMVAATGMGRVYRTEGGSRSNLYIVNVLEPGAGKDHGRTVIQDTLRAAEMAGNIAGGAKSGSAVCTTLLQQPLQVYRIDEFGMILQRASAEGPKSNFYDLMETLMKLYTSSHTVYQVDHYADQRRRPNREVLYPCVNLLGSTAPATFYPALNSGSVASGFLSRFLVLAADGCPKKNRSRVDEQPPGDVVAWLKQLRQGVEGKNIVGRIGDQPIIVPSTDEARAMYLRFDDECDQRAEDDKNHITKLLWRRAAEMADKIALLCAGADKMTIDEEHMAWSTGLIRWRTQWLIEHLKTSGADTEYESAKKRACAAIRATRDKGLPLKGIGQHAPFSGWSRRFRREVIDDMVENGEVFKVSSNHAGKGRPPVMLVAADYVEGKGK